MNKTVDNYFLNGCGRCPLGGTPECKIHSWIDELQAMRNILQDSDLVEESKWGVPCYTFQNKNVLIAVAFKDFCSISFFKGALLKDPENILEKPGPHSQVTSRITFNHIEQIKSLEPIIKSYVEEAIQLEKIGQKIKFNKNPEPIPKELLNKFEEDPMLKDAFDNLTPGRQRGYIIFITQPKQSKTRIGRIEKCIPKILNGEGLQDKYKSMKK